MDVSVKIHNDHCENMEKEDIQAILDQVTALVTSALLRATTQSESSDIAA